MLRVWLRTPAFAAGALKYYTWWGDSGPGSAFLPFWLSLAALRHLPPTTAGIVATVEPVLASVVAWLWVEQVLTGWQVAGGAVVLAGIVLAQTARSASPTAVPETVAG